jgi:hypothetical protein
MYIFRSLQYLRTYHLHSALILTVPIPNLPVSVAEKALESLSSPPPFGGRMKDVSFPELLFAYYGRNKLAD